MPVAIHILVYCAFAVVAAFFLLYIWVSGSLRSYQRGMFLGLLLSPLGLVLPYALFFGVGFLYYGSSGPHDFSDAYPAFRVFMLLLLFLGPLVGPPAIFSCMVARFARTPRA